MTQVTKEAFGSVPGVGTVDKFRLESEGVTVEILTLGCIISALKTRDRNGRSDDIVLGFDTLESYLTNPRYFGAVVGRVANRIANGKFTVDGKEYQLAINNGPNALHGGPTGFHQAIWNAEVLPNGVRLSLTSADGHEGYPGELQVSVTYMLEGDVLSLYYEACTNKTTPVNLTNHSYFNLAGQGTPDIYDHEISISADAYLPVESTMIPTGDVQPVKGTPFDLRSSVRIGDRLSQLPDRGFDHNFCLSSPEERRETPKYFSRVYHPGSGRVLNVATTQPGVQFYTSNFLDASIKGKGGAAYPKHSAFCLETQNWPDAVNKPHFPDALLRPGDDYGHTTWFQFSTA
ncbi:aldose 1-epimerase [Erpetoichthys calabaricus]|uniref:aldose 1-epimerase n=1 Tax=Erpetoichthys calabaricus TaxID=27687 RepID=UPI00223498F7|nr:aldose 1-epimerase [Erpetoichthys calabaricus]